ncbi:nucleolar RNA helicase 2-like protein [Columba guinea]|nr:nucleolar RNA helicase 2-like protein [Columba guinea]
MPEATRFSASSGAESDPECPMESESALESSRRRRKKEKKEKKSKRHDKSRRRKAEADESEQSEEDVVPPKLKKSKSGVKQNGHVREESPENTRLSSLKMKSTLKKQHSNSSETSSGDGDSEPEQEMTEEQKEGALSNFPISKGTVQLLQARGVTYLFPVQVKTFDPVYAGKDVIAQARTGTGKTFSFAIPLIEKLQGDTQERRRGRAPKVLVLCPTRELANQVAKDFKDITRKLTVACFYGGTPYNGQIDLMRSGIDILVGTPGRIKDHLQNGKLDLTKVKHVVLDEVDQMLDMGFAEQVEDILRVAYKKDSEDNPQTLLFSATCPHWVYDVAKKYMKSRYEQVDLIGKKTQKAATTVEHLAIECHWSQRAAVIGDVIQVYSGSYGRTIVFCETKKEANELALNASIKQDCQSLHGDIPQKQREITLKGFRNGAFKVLVATNVAARGLDIPEVDLVVQSSPPKDVESYIHRSGRTGRAGRTGICICFYQRKEEHQLRYVEQKAGITFKRVGVPTATDIIKASSKDAIRCLDSVPETAIEYFKESARLLVQEKGPVNALAAALAHISGATSIEQRSLLNSDAGFVTMILRCSEEINNMSYAWRRLRELLGDDVDRKVNRMCFLKGKMGVCFDVPAADRKDIEELTEEAKEGAFSNFPLSQNTISLLKARGVKYLFPVQVKTFQPIYDGKDVIAQARTGTGKTFSFALPLVEKLQSVSQDGRRGRSPKVLVLVPTRELATQVAKDFKHLTRKLSVACFYGGTPYREQLDLLKSGIDILVGTPGRIKDHIQNSKLELSSVKHVVLDEVDHMLDMGFAEQVEEILGFAYKKGSENNPQTLLFSATCPRWVYDVAKKYMKDEYEQIDLIGKKTQRTATTVEHLAIQCRSSQRAGVLGDIIQVYSGSRGRTIVFCETKKEANELAMNASLKQDAQSLHGDIPQQQREVTLKGFRTGVFEVLIATNVAARGLDIPEVDLVIQCSPPKDVDSYIHRSGRTGRAGRTGVCICLFQRREEDLLKQVEHKAGITFKRVGVPSATDVIKASSNDAKKLLEAIPPSAVDYFRKSAQELIDEKGAVAALAAALAHISGASYIQQRSLLNSTAGFVTMVLKCSIEMRSMSYAWRGLKEQLGEEVDGKISAMRFLKGKMGVCFDIPVDELSNIQEQWKDTRRWQLSVPEELPELEESPQEAGRGFSRFGNGRQSDGGFKRNNWFKNGNRGRDFNKSLD